MSRVPGEAEHLAGRSWGGAAAHTPCLHSRAQHSDRVEFRCCPPSARSGEVTHSEDGIKTGFVLCRVLKAEYEVIPAQPLPRAVGVPLQDAAQKGRPVLSKSNAPSRLGLHHQELFRSSKDRGAGGGHLSPACPWSALIPSKSLHPAPERMHYRLPVAVCFKNTWDITEVGWGRCLPSTGSRRTRSLMWVHLGHPLPLSRVH